MSYPMSPVVYDVFVKQIENVLIAFEAGEIKQRETVLRLLINIYKDARMAEDDPQLTVK